MLKLTALPVVGLPGSSWKATFTLHFLDTMVIDIAEDNANSKNSRINSSVKIAVHLGSVQGVLEGRLGCFQTD